MRLARLIRIPGMSDVWPEHDHEDFSPGVEFSSNKDENSTGKEKSSWSCRLVIPGISLYLPTTWATETLVALPCPAWRPGSL